MSSFHICNLYIMNDPTNSGYRYIHFKGMGGYRRYISSGSNTPLEEFTLSSYQQNIPAHGSYNAFLFDQRWKTKRQKILKRDDYCCVICKNKENLQVHHRQYHFLIRESQYKPPWDYEDRLLITLCEFCHRRGHNKYKVPTITM